MRNNSSDGMSLSRSGRGLRESRSLAVIERLEDRRLLSAAVHPALSIIGTPTPMPIVAAPLGQGVTLHETARVKFTASLGTFITIAPGTNLHATIDWGDGRRSLGTVKAIGVIGIDEINFEVDGTHTYLRRGTYTIHVTVTQPSPTATSPVRHVANITSTAIVSRKTVLLNGTIEGTYLLAPTIPDIGATYVFNGTGTAGDLGPVAAHALVTLPGFIVSGHATGTLTLDSISASPVASGSVTLRLTGPTESGFGPFPSTLAFVITGGTGAFAGATGSGTIAVTLGGATANSFTFVITSLLPPAV